jgi:hypothetical protein
VQPQQQNVQSQVNLKRTNKGNAVCDASQLKLQTETRLQEQKQLSMHNNQK